MTATEPASLDALLAAATPVEAEPFDLGARLDDIETPWSSQPVKQRARAEIARHVNAERVRTEQARALAATLEQECADKGRRIAEAVRWLETAESYSVSEDCSAAIDDAMAALRGET